MKFVLCLVTAVSLVSAACANGSTQDSEHWDDLLSVSVHDREVAWDYIAWA